MIHDAMRFVHEPTGATFVLLHTVPLPGELLYSPDGKTFYPLQFTSPYGQRLAGHIEVEYEFTDPLTGHVETLIHENGAMTRSRGNVEYRIDHDHRSLDDSAITRQ